MRIKTKYPGVYYREVKRIGGKGIEKVYYIIFKKDCKTIEEKVGRQFIDDMTPARAAGIRADRIEGKRKSRKEIKEYQKLLRESKENRWTVDKLWKEYKTILSNTKGFATDDGRYKNYLKQIFGNNDTNEINPLEIDRLRKNLSKKLAPQTVKHVLSLLDRIINFGVKRGLCDRLSFHIQKPRVSKQFKN